MLTKHNADLIIAKNAAEKATEAEKQRTSELEKSLYVNQMMFAQAAWNEPDLRRTVDVLDATKPELRQLEWNYAARLAMSTKELRWNQRPVLEPKLIHHLTPSTNGAWLMARFVEENAIEPENLIGSIKVLPTASNVSREPELSAIHLSLTLGAAAQILCFSPSGDEVLCRVPVKSDGVARQYRLALVAIQTGQAIWQTEPLIDHSTSIFKAGFVLPQPIADETKLPGVDETLAKPNGPQFAIITDPQMTSAELGVTFE